MRFSSSEIELLDQVQSIEKQIGNTPLIPLRNLVNKPGVRLYAKAEWQQFGGSVKSRPAFRIIREAILEGKLDRTRRLLDASSGNTAIAYASIGASLGIPVTICLPENASEERKQILKALGAEVVLTSPFGGTDEAQETAREIKGREPGKYFYADQYNNENNWKAHYHGTGTEIFEQTEGRITHFVAGLGTTGSFTGTGRKLKELNPEIQLISLQPDSVLHGLEGWKHLESARVPGIYDPSISREEFEIETFEAYHWIRKAAEAEGLLLSPSSAANLAGALRVVRNIDKGTVVTLFPDNGEKYGDVLSTIYST